MQFIKSSSIKLGTRDHHAQLLENRVSRKYDELRNREDQPEIRGDQPRV